MSWMPGFKIAIKNIKNDYSGQFDCVDRRAGLYLVSCSFFTLRGL